VTPTEILRWSWTIASAIGAGYAFWNLRQALITNWAVHQVRKNAGVDTVKMVTRDDVWLHAYILAALGANAMAGATAIAGQSLLALISLIVSAALLVGLSLTHAQRLKRIFSQIRLRRLYTEEPHAENPIQ